MPARPLRCFIYGATRTGKTTFAGSWPKPVFLSAGNEGGDTTLRHLPGVTVIPVNSSLEMKEAVAAIEQESRELRYGWKTVVIDSATFYADIYISELTAKKGVMTQRDWGSLDIHLQKWLLPTLHRLPSMHIVWIALEQHVKDGDGNILKTIPMLYGKTAEKLPATTDMILHAEQALVPGAEGKMVTKFLLRTRAWAGAIAGDRFGNAFADGWIEPHFSYIAQRIGPYIGEPVPQPSSPNAMQAAGTNP